jgi:hypothetical protein
VAAAVAAGLVPSVLFDPRATGCFECPRNLLLLQGDAGLRDALLRDGTVGQRRGVRASWPGLLRCASRDDRRFVRRVVVAGRRPRAGRGRRRRGDPRA